MASLNIGEPQLGRQQADSFAEKAADESRGEIEAQPMGAVARHDDRRVIGGCIVRQPDMHRARYIADNQFASVGVNAFRQDLAEGRWIERGAQIQATRRRRQDQCTG